VSAVDATLMDDVLELDVSGRISLRDWLSGARPVVGCLGAGGLKILACSWFALGVGGLGLLPGDAGAHRTLQISAGSPRPDAVSRTTAQRRGALPTTPPTRASRAAVQPVRSDTSGTPEATAGGVDEAADPATPGAGSAKPPAAPVPAATAGPTPGTGLQEPPPPPNVLDVVAPVLETVAPPPLPVPLPVSLPVPDVTAVTGELGLP
jgi:hypothetical protein